ncbi:MAG: aromatic ring-hydroxylating dioxygenase subunit alpha [Burkholderiaceae bacterium]|jgi:phenylpropionate dioxygenase-like ring-hydroxylating dioxygenase large terminal subunit|nr:aromatic ring-hydroxylating dioxygenase subunit alpha [Burkholderiaceae bacterium]
MDKQMSETLVRTGPGTSLGNVMRRYWVPILLSHEIAGRDCPQVRVRIMGEKLLAFRDSDGHAALISEFCSHRGVSLFFGRNEDNGIRCGYHGVKFDRHGHCVDVPSLPKTREACKHLDIRAYPCIERAGIVWAYMGPKDKQPEPPNLEWCNLPESHVFVSKRWQECNYLQAMEGGIDTSHVSYTHAYEVGDDPLHKDSKALKYFVDGNVIFEVEQQPHGLTMFGRRNGEPDSYYWRITQWLFPWYTLIPPFGDHAMGGHAWIPMDDENCWAWSINFHPNRPLTKEERAACEAGKGIHCEYEVGTNVPGGSFRPKANKDNDYLIDRKGQKKNLTYTGVYGIATQDTSLQESMGPIQDRSDAAEILLPTDRAIVMARRMLHEAAVANSLMPDADPPAVDSDRQYVRAAGVLLPRGQKPQTWAAEHLNNGKDKPVYSI